MPAQAVVDRNDRVASVELLQGDIVLLAALAEGAAVDPDDQRQRFNGARQIEVKHLSWVAGGHIGQIAVDDRACGECIRGVRHRQVHLLSSGSAVHGAGARALSKGGASIFRICIKYSTLSGAPNNGLENESERAFQLPLIRSVTGATLLRLCFLSSPFSFFFLANRIGSGSHPLLS